MGRPDDADEIAAAWRRERPGTPTESIGVVTRIWQLGKLFADDRRRVLAELDIDRGTMDLLSVLRRAGPPYALTTRTLAERTLVTAGAISQRVARAEAAGLVTRAPGGTGRRAVTVTLTAAGHAEIERVVDRVLRREVELLSGLPPAGRADLARDLSALLDDLIERLGPPARTGE
ncbi:MarR family transcriptional regulator [Actinocatenispora thailandica]|uniref:MarR family transcriptional regulator n=1 Tax=Actinocatenispora thailandica TaxID=227318 RepID=A0A7R7HYY9_9ACTN|nr:MarR family transcriptional regulator [Actinocatenispora thailandica]BCJ36784.1 MarR family transcriptional regulator [Actinocatenispora thailandica]